VTKATKGWLRGLVAAVINGFASGVVLIIADPLEFNLLEGRSKLLATSAVLGLLGAANYLKQSPVPPDDAAEPRS
jgi:hypothetical protein